MSEANGRCDDCGRFISYDAPGVSWGERYDMVAMCCDYVHFRCPRCTEKFGPAFSNARPCDGDMSPYQGMNPIPDQQEEQ